MGLMDTCRDIHVVAMVIVTMVITLGGYATACPSACVCDESTLKVQCDFNQPLTNFPTNIPKNTSVLVISGFLSQTKPVLNDLRAENLAEFVHLTEITLKHLGLTSVDSNAFHNLAKLEKLDLSYNELTDLPTDIFANLTKMIYLDLSNNKLTRLEPEQLNFPELTLLSLLGNNITLRDSKIFEKLSKLHLLDVSDNHVGETAPSYVGPMNLRIVRMNNCRIRTLSSGLPEFVKNANSLELKSNVIDDLPPTFLPSLTNLDELYLDSNRLTKLQNETFKTLNLTACSLANNKITTIETNAFSSFSTIMLRLNDNMLTSLSAGVFSALGANLKKLYIGGNPFGSLEDGWFSGLTGLTRLHLSNSQIATISDNAFQNLKTQELILSKNQLSFVSNNTLDMFSDKTLIGKVDLSSNTWNCSSILVGLKDWLVANAQSTNCGGGAGSADVNCLKCATPEKYRDRFLVDLTTEELITALDPETTTVITTEEITTEELTTEKLTTEKLTTEDATTEQMTTEQVTTEQVTTNKVTTHSHIHPAAIPVSMVGVNLMIIYIACACAAVLIIFILICMTIKLCYYSREVTYPVGQKEMENGHVIENQGAKTSTNSLNRSDKFESPVRLEYVFTISDEVESGAVINPAFRVGDDEGYEMTTLPAMSTFKQNKSSQFLTDSGADTHPRDLDHDDDPGVDSDTGRDYDPCRDSGIVGDSSLSISEYNRQLPAHSDGYIHHRAVDQFDLDDDGDRPPVSAYDNKIYSTFGPY